MQLTNDDLAALVTEFCGVVDKILAKPTRDVPANLIVVGEDGKRMQIALLTDDLNDHRRKPDLMHAAAKAVVSARDDGDGGVSFFSGLEGQSEDRAIAGDAGISRRLFGADFENACGWIIVLHNDKLLAVLNQDSALGDADEAQEIGIVVDLYSHRGNVRSVREHRI